MHAAVPPGKVRSSTAGYRCPRIVVWLFLIAMVGTTSVHGAWPLPATQTCNSSCQTFQRGALTLLYTSTGAQTWARPVEMDANGTAVPITQWGFSVPQPLPLPIHCYWAGVYCCDPAGYISMATGYSYVATGQIPCDVAYGVTSLVLPTNNMTGAPPGAVWPPLAGSLSRLELSGECQSALLLSPLQSSPATGLMEALSQAISLLATSQHWRC